MYTTKHCAGRSRYTKTFEIQRTPKRDVGKWRIRLSRKNRFGSERHCLLRVSHGSNCGTFIALGLEDSNDDVAQMDFDVRNHLGIDIKKNGPHAELTIARVGAGLGALCWYLEHRDPNVRVPARAWAISVVLGILGLVSGIAGIVIALCTGS